MTEKGLLPSLKGGIFVLPDDGRHAYNSYKSTC